MKKFLTVVVPLLLIFALCLPPSTVQASELVSPTQAAVAQDSPVIGTGVVVEADVDPAGIMFVRAVHLEDTVALDEGDAELGLPAGEYDVSVVEGENGTAVIVWRTDYPVLREMLSATETLDADGDSTLMPGDTVHMHAQEVEEAIIEMTFEIHRDDAFVGTLAFLMEGNLADIQPPTSNENTDEAIEVVAEETRRGVIFNASQLDEAFNLTDGDEFAMTVREMTDGTIDVSVDIYRGEEVAASFSVDFNNQLGNQSDHWAGSTVTNGSDVVSAVTININGVETQSDENGKFDLSVPRADDSRYVINAKQAGYLPISQIHIGSALEELTLEFQPVEQFSVDPTQPIATEDSRGTQIKIDAGQLVDADGNPATEELTLNTYTYDLTNEEMVGDMSGTNTEGEPVYMESAGAFYAEFTDDAGGEYNLAPGAAAEISIPADVPNRDETLTVWSYNPETGLWEEEGEATLVDGRYVANVSHFSYWNFDWEMSQPACIKLNIDAHYLAASPSLQVKAVFQTTPQTVRTLNISQEETVLVNLPVNIDVEFFMPPTAAMPIAKTNSGAAWGGVGNPAYPYDACHGTAEIAHEPEPTTGAVQGQVTDAVSGNPIAGAQVCLQGANQCASTDDNGNYIVSDVSAGDHALTVAADGYISVNDQAVTITAGETTTQPVAMSPELAEGELRIVLTWGAEPTDLDSYLWLPDSTPIHHEVKEQTIQGAKLDLDDQDGNGPETITISERVDGTYSYAVYNYGRGNLGEQTTIPASSAVVRVYKGDQEINTFTAPATGDGNWWYIFDMDGATGTITSVNTLSNNSPK